MVHCDKLFFLAGYVRKIFYDVYSISDETTDRFHYKRIICIQIILEIIFTGKFMFA